uniref:Uncharacterized protein n=1 Tax=Quercus lobata TaxID=97700 RepID=A0A7N2LGB1_QUELO
MQNLFDMEPDNQLEDFTIIDIPQVWDLEPDKQPECCIYRGELAKCVQEEELKIRHCYAENFHEIGKEDFVKMILLDSIFIIEHLWCITRYPEENNIHENVFDILHDLILLENQVPFSVLEELYNFAYLDLPSPG